MPPATAKVTSKGQITLPVKMREELGIGPGDRIEFAKNDSGRFEVLPRKKSFADLRGILKTDIVLSDEELQKAIGDAAGARWARFVAQDDEGRN